MAFVYPDVGRNFFEEASVDSTYSATIDTIAIGNGTSAPSASDTSLDSQLYEATSGTAGITIERGGGTGEIRGVIEFTGGTEVPADSDIRELAFKASDGTLVYRELRSSPINVQSGETKIVEIRMFVEDADVETNQTITDVGLEFIADRAIGNSSDYINTIAVGDGTSDVSSGDTGMQSELYRNDDSGDNTVVQPTGNAGDVRAEITLSAGPNAEDEVSGGDSISEFALITNGGTLVLHETRTGVVLEQSDTKTFKIPLTIIQ